MLFWLKTKTESKNLLYTLGLALFIASFLFTPSMALLEESEEITEEEKEEIVTEITDQIDEKQDKIDEYDYPIKIPEIEIKPIDWRPAHLSLI